MLVSEWFVVLERNCTFTDWFESSVPIASSSRNGLFARRVHWTAFVRTSSVRFADAVQLVVFHCWELSHAEVFAGLNAAMPLSSAAGGRRSRKAMSASVAKRMDIT